MLTRIISVIQLPEFHDLWDRLNDKGILEGKLINHVWKDFQPEDRLQFLSVMEQYDLICVAPNIVEKEQREKQPWERMEPQTHSTTPIHERKYYVPSLFKPKQNKDDSESEYWASLTFFVDIKGLFTSKWQTIRDCLTGCE